MIHSKILSNAKNEKYLYYKKKYEDTLKNNNNQRIIEKYNQYSGETIYENFILYETFHGKSMTDNPYALFKYLIENHEYKDYKHIWVINSHSIEIDKYKDHDNVIFVKVHTDDYLYYLAKSKYLINNTSFPPYFCKRENQIYINTWHGTPLKTLGKDMNGPIDQLKNIQRNFLQTNYILSPNEFTTDKLVSSHNLNGIYTGEVLEVGYPRIDLITNTDSSEITNKLKTYIEIDSNKKIALYAPTWRGNVGREVDIKEEVKDIIVSMKSNLDPKYQLLLKVHPLLYKYFKDDKELSNFFIPDSIDISETLSIIDLLITDYSSVFFDYYVKNKPIILYTYDKEEYLSDRGTYLEFEDLNTYIAENEIELNKLISNIDGLEGCQNESYISLQNGRVSETVIDIIFKENNRLNKKVINDKKNVLFYIDNLLENSFNKKAAYINECFSRDKYNVIVLVKTNLTYEEELQIKKLNDVKLFFRFGNLNTSEKSWIEYMIAMDIGYVNNDEKLLNNLAKKELERLIGNLEIDYIYNMSNNVFWQIILGYYPDTKVEKYQIFDQKTITKIRGNSSYYYYSFIKKFDKYFSFEIESLKMNEEINDININYVNINLMKFENKKSVRFLNEKDLIVEVDSKDLNEKYALIKDFNFEDKYIFIDVVDKTYNEVISFYNLLKNQKFFDTYKVLIYGMEITSIEDYNNELLTLNDLVLPTLKNTLDYLEFAKQSNYMFVLKDFKYSMDKVCFLNENNVKLFVTDSNDLLELVYEDYLSIYEWKTFFPIIEKYDIESNIYV